MILEAAPSWKPEKSSPLPVVTYRNIKISTFREEYHGIVEMGNWKLEIAKMVIYMAFPVTSFYVYHQVL